MKTLAYFLLLVISLAKHCSALDDITKDKRYPFVEYIASAANDLDVSEYLDYARIHAELLEELADSLPAEKLKSKEFQELYIKFKELFAVVIKLEVDRENCDLQKDVHAKLVGIEPYKAAAGWKDFNGVKVKEEEFRDVNYERLKNGIFSLMEELPAESFLKSLTAEEIKEEKYKAAIAGCEQMSKTRDNWGKLFFFEIILTDLRMSKEFETDSCKWDSLQKFFPTTRLVVDKFTNCLYQSKTCL